MSIGHNRNQIITEQSKIATLSPKEQFEYTALQRQLENIDMDDNIRMVSGKDKLSEQDQAILRFQELKDKTKALVQHNPEIRLGFTLLSPEDQEKFIQIANELNYARWGNKTNELENLNLKYNEYLEQIREASKNEILSHTIGGNRGAVDDVLNNK